MKEYVLGFVFERETYPTDSPNVLLMLKQRPDNQRKMFNGVGGKVEPRDRTSLLAMRREFTEETGINGDFLDFESFGEMRGRDWVVHLFTAWGENLQSANNEDSEVPTLVPIGYVDYFFKTNKCLENIPWLSRLAYCFLTGKEKKPLSIVYPS